MGLGLGPGFGFGFGFGSGLGLGVRVRVDRAHRAPDNLEPMARLELPLPPEICRGRICRDLEISLDLHPHLVVELHLTVAVGARDGRAWVGYTWLGLGLGSGLGVGLGLGSGLRFGFGVGLGSGVGLRRATPSRTPPGEYAAEIAGDCRRSPEVAE